MTADTAGHILIVGKLLQIERDTAAVVWHPYDRQITFSQPFKLVEQVAMMEM